MEHCVIVRFKMTIASHFGPKFSRGWLPAEVEQSEKPTQPDIIASFPHRELQQEMTATGRCFLAISLPVQSILNVCFEAAFLAKKVRMNYTNVTAIVSCTRARVFLHAFSQLNDSCTIIARNRLHRNSRVMNEKRSFKTKEASFSCRRQAF